MTDGEQTPPEDVDSDADPATADHAQVPAEVEAVPEDVTDDEAGDGVAESPAASSPRRSRRRVGILLLLLGALIVLGGAWIAVTGLLARSQLDDAKADLATLRTQLTADRVDAARSTLDDLADHADNADWMTSGPAWALAADLPGGQPFETVRGIASTVRTLSHQALPALLNARSTLEPSRLRTSDGSLDVARVARAAPGLATADRAVTSSLASVRALPAVTWLSTVGHARAQLLTQLGDIAGTVHDADLAARILPPMLGNDGVRRYFVAFQNEAEARGTGGVPGAFGILRVDHGAASFERFENDGFLAETPTGLDLGAEYNVLYGGADPTSKYVNSNISPDFSYAARIWIAMWAKRTGERLDGALALDPTALSYLLQVTGGATLPDGSSVDAANVVQLTQSTAYVKYASDNDARKQFLLEIAKAVSERIVHAHGDATGLLDALRQGARERRILVWSAHAATEAELERTDVSGVIPDTSGPYSGVSIVNVAGNKLDYYLDRSVTWKAGGCGPSRTVTVTVRLTNNAPGTGLPPYVTGRIDPHPYGAPGDNELQVEYFATHGAVTDSITVDGRSVSVSSGIERGHQVFVVLVGLPHGTTRTVVFRLTEPDDGRPLQVLRQPLVRPLSLTLDPARCGD